MSLGIENTREVLVAISAGYDSALTVFKGGKVKPLQAALAFADLQDEISAAVKDIDQIPAEIKDIDEKELAELGALTLPLIRKIVALAKSAKKTNAPK